MGGPGVAIGVNFGPAAVRVSASQAAQPPLGAPRELAPRPGGALGSRPQLHVWARAVAEEKGEAQGDEGERGGPVAEGGVSPGVLVYLGGSALGCR